MALFLEILGVGSLISAGKWLHYEPHDPFLSHATAPCGTAGTLGAGAGCRVGCTQGGRWTIPSIYSIGWTRPVYRTSPDQYNEAQINNISPESFRPKVVFPGRAGKYGNFSTFSTLP